MPQRQGLKAQLCVVLVTAACGVACGEDPDPVGLLARMADGSYSGVMLPPINTGCGKLQPGFDPGEPDADPPIPPSLNGEPYIPENDPFCSVAWTEQFTTEADGVHLDEWIYVAAIGEPADVPIPAWHSEDEPQDCEITTDSLKEAPYFYCHLKWSVEAEPFEDHGVEHTQHLRFTLEEVSHYCSVECRGPAGYQPGDEQEHWVTSSTRPDAWIALVDGENLEKVGGSPLFKGYFGLPETGGAMTRGEVDAGRAFFYETCDPDEIAGEEGPGVCPSCRLVSDGLNSAGTDVEFEACTWDDFSALPADEGMVDPEWRAEYSSLYQQVYGHP